MVASDINWGSVAEWANATAVIVAAFVAAQTVRGYFTQRAAERQSDLATDVLEAAYKYEADLNWIRSLKETLKIQEVMAPQLSDFQISVRKLEVYEKYLNNLATLHTRLVELIPLVSVVFGNELETSLALIANTYVRLAGALQNCRQYNIEGQNRLLLGEEFTGWDFDGVKIGPEQVAYYWAIMLDDEADTSQMRQQMLLGKGPLYAELTKIVRAKFR